MPGLWEARVPGTAAEIGTLVVLLRDPYGRLLSTDGRLPEELVAGVRVQWRGPLRADDSSDDRHPRN
jgi:hypothetical protein